MTSYPLKELLPHETESAEATLGRFMKYLTDVGLDLYPAQEEAILSLFDDQNVILNTPTGSGKSLVATAYHFLSLAKQRRSFYTCPIKALVNEKFLKLCQDFGPDNVGMMTGDATVNPDAPILCCTAEILANLALREGAMAPVQDVIMDEFHYYGDQDRGVAWEIPLLTLDYARFLLMSATIGNPEKFVSILETRTGKPAVVISSDERPVPLDFSYKQTPLHETISSLIQQNQAPLYLVNFTQREASEQAQNLMSVDLLTKDEKKQLSQALGQTNFNSPFGKDLKNILRHGIGIHHAGLLPKYRLLVEKLAQKGLLKIISGTDTLGVGVNVPIRSVVFTKLCKFDGKKTSVLSVRDFQQISGRAGRRGFDTKGSIIVQAPEHVVHNKQLESKAKGDPKKMKRLKRKPAPTKHYAHWDESTFDKLLTATPEELRSSFRVDHGMVLAVLSRSTDGCQAMQQIIRNAHITPEKKQIIGRKTFKIFRSLLERNIVELHANANEKKHKISLNIELQEEFSIFQSLGIWLLDEMAQLEKEDDNYAFDLLTLVESTVENPRAVLVAQEKKERGKKIAELKEEGLSFDERIEIVDEITYPKPNAEAIYQSFNAFCDSHPWLDTENIKPKSIARQMCEELMGFREYIKEYGLQRSEGVLLRYLSQVYKVLTQTIPSAAKTAAVEEIILFLRAICKDTDHSLLAEWEALKSQRDVVKILDEKEHEQENDITRNTDELVILLRNETFKLVRALKYGQFSAFIDAIDPTQDDKPNWNERHLQDLIDVYRNEHKDIEIHQRARLREFFRIERSKCEWVVEQTLTDPDELDDWYVKLRLDLEKTKAQQSLHLELLYFGEK